MFLPEGGKLVFRHTRNVFSPDEHFAARRFFQTRQLIEQRTLAGTGCSEDTADFPSVDGKVDVF